MTKPVALRKITPKAVYNEAKDASLMQEAKKIPEGKAFKVMTLLAYITSKKQVVNDLGDSTKFVGRFRAINGKDESKVFQSSSLFLPGYLEEEVEANFDANGGFPMGFALELYIKDDSKNENNTLGWCYSHAYLGDVEEGDPLDALAENAGVMKAIPAPDKAPEPSKPKDAAKAA